MRGFSNEERNRIREQLIETGRELLLTYGPNKTTVEDITEPVGIAKATFYRFFEAKSDLYFVILERDLEEYMENVNSALEGVNDPQERLERFFWCYVEFGEGDPFIQQTIIRSNYQDVFGNISAEQLEEIIQKEMAVFCPHIEDIQEQSDGPISEMDPIMVLGLMGATLGLLVLHKDEYDKYTGMLEEFNEKFYKQLQTVLISTLARGLIIEE